LPLTNLPEDEVDEILAGHRLRKEEATTIRAYLGAIRECAYAISSAALAPGIWGVNAPVFNEGGSLAGVVTTMVPLQRAGTEEARARFITCTCRAAADLGQVVAPA
jgi:DNA-binding IclR family transcriptional regulator